MILIVILIRKRRIDIGRFEIIIELDKHYFKIYKNLSKNDKKKFREKYTKTFRYQFLELNWIMRKYIRKEKK
jgi:hypothetical protein